LTIGVELELSEELPGLVKLLELSEKYRNGNSDKLLLELSWKDGIGNDGGHDSKLLPELLRENNDINGIATEFRLLSAFGVELELLGLVKLLELSEDNEVGSDNVNNDKSLSTIGVELELPEKLLGLVELLELSDKDKVGNDGVYGNKLLLGLLKENDGINGIAAEFRLLLVFGVELELLEKLLGLVKPPELLEGDGARYSVAGGTYEGVNDDGNISGNTDVG
jgi:hypothetical protein